MEQLRRTTLAEQAYIALRDRITQGELPAGHRLLPEELGQVLLISPTPVKEALAMLQRDGLIEVEARRGSSVRRFTNQDIEELYDARMMVERHALATGLRAGRVDDAFLARADEAAALCARHGSRRARADLRQALRHDHDLHTLLVELAANAVTSEWHQRLLRQTQLVRAYTLRAFDAGRLVEALRDHAAILAGLRARNMRAAVAALEAHLLTSRRNVQADYG